MRATAEGGPGQAEAGFTALWLDRASAAAAGDVARAKPDRPETDFDHVVARFTDSNASTLAAAERADRADGVPDPDAD